jgi:hypothetical protein
MAARMSRPSNPTSALLPPPFTPEAITAVDAIATVQRRSSDVIAGLRLPVLKHLFLSAEKNGTGIGQYSGSVTFWYECGCGSVSKSSMTFGIQKNYISYFLMF